MTTRVESEDKNIVEGMRATIRAAGLTPTQKEILELHMGLRDGISVPLEEIFSVGPPKDGIPSIDHPRFVPIAEADRWLGDQEPGIMFSRGRTHRFYPYQILVWHEIVNDTVPAQSGAEGAGERILVTYC
ncbi:MAG: DUF3179 domain-containing protein, partial [Candidatus Wildermuthbacteria bacterium]|nr:DUF3179 domain-containing protein [Candidatus Wildermuthbacteria bacterium]